MQSTRTRVATALAAAAALSVLAAGCMTARQSDTARTGVEQLLLSTALDRAAAQFDFEPLVGRTVEVDLSNLASVDQGYAAHVVRTRLLDEGANLANGEDLPDAILEVASGGVGTDGSHFLIGLPPISLQALGSGFSTPELALFKSITQFGVAKLHLQARNADDGEVLHSPGPKQGDSYYHRYTLLIVSFRRTDVPGK